MGGMRTGSNVHFLLSPKISSSRVNVKIPDNNYPLAVIVTKKHYRYK